MPSPRTCPACGKPQGTSAACLSCRDAAARELADGARDVTDQGALEARVEAVGRFLDRPPWYVRLAAGTLLTRLRLLWMLLGDYARGRYRKIPWKTVAICAGAVGYVISPIDLIPDWFVPIGLTDDMLVLALAWRSVKNELRAYCAWKGVSPAHFGI